jgi:lactate racemase
VTSGRPEAVQELLAADVRRRFQAQVVAPADIVVAGNHPWPGDPMQSFKVLLHHRAACRPGGVLVGFFWTDPDEIERSFPRSALRLIAATGAPGGWAIRSLVPLVQRAMSAAGSPSAFMLRWACELVVDRTVLVFSPPLRAQIGLRLGPVRLFAEQPALWQAALEAVKTSRSHSLDIRIFPQGGLTYVPQSPPLQG